MGTHIFKMRINFIFPFLFIAIIETTFSQSNPTTPTTSTTTNASATSSPLSTTTSASGASTTTNGSKPTTFPPTTSGLMKTTTTTNAATTTSAAMTTDAQKIECPENWIDAQGQNLGCLLFLNQTELSWFDTLAACEDALGFSIEVLSKDEAIILYEMAEIAQIFTGVSQWWVGLSDFPHEGNWKWSQSSTNADLSLYIEFFNPNNSTQNTDDCVIMSIIDRDLQWIDIDCFSTSYKGGAILPICQCKGDDCQGQTTAPTVTTSDASPTTTSLVCSDNWIDAGALGCIQFMPDQPGQTFIEAKQLCEASKGFLVETKTTEAIEFVSTLANVIHSYTPEIDSWWIGLYQVGAQWIWTESYDVADVFNWDVGQPNDHNGCVILTRNVKGEYKWDDVDCDLGEFNGLGIAAICQECRPEDNCNSDTTANTNTTAMVTETSTSTSPPVPWPTDCKNNTDLNACYLHVTTKATWIEAEQDCSSLGGHLASSVSEVENTFIGENVIMFENVWIGGTDFTGSWAWSDQQPWDYENWKTGEPSDGSCTYFNWQTYKWTAYDCTYKLKYVCKFV